MTTQTVCYTCGKSLAGKVPYKCKTCGELQCSMECLKKHIKQMDNA